MTLPQLSLTEPLAVRIHGTFAPEAELLLRMKVIEARRRNETAPEARDRLAASAPPDIAEALRALTFPPPRRGRPPLAPEDRKPPSPRKRRPGESGQTRALTPEEVTAQRVLLGAAARRVGLARIEDGDYIPITSAGVWSAIARAAGLVVEGRPPSLRSARQVVSDGWRGRKLPVVMVERLRVFVAGSGAARDLASTPVRPCDWVRDAAGEVPVADSRAPGFPGASNPAQTP